jgi:GTPase Era involved in 16S rRNA processing
MLTVGCAGLPSAGKSTFVNSIAGARLLETGVCRTTKGVQLVGPELAFGLDEAQFKRARVVSDDGVEFQIIDLPGVADAENTGSEANFNALTLEWAAKCDVVLWVTDVRTCFLTTHEKAEFDRLMVALAQRANEDGALFQYCIVLAKCDVEVDEQTKRARRSTKYLPGEITTDHEETTVRDCIERARRLFPNERVVPFNAFGRILERDDASEALKALAQKLAQNTCKVNTRITLKWVTESLVEKQQAQILRAMFNHVLPRAPGGTQPEYWPTGVDAALELKGTTLKLAAMKARLLVPGALTLLCHCIGHCAKTGPKFEAPETCLRHARLIGQFDAAAHAAASYEAQIVEYASKRGDAVKARIVATMLYLCGPACAVTARMYLRLTRVKSHQIECVGVVGAWNYYPTHELVLPRTLRAIVPMLPACVAVDLEYAADRTLSARASWVGRVRAERRALWGAAEDDVCIERVFALVDSAALGSVLAPVF